MHQLGKPGEHTGIGLGQHAMAEVEHVAFGRAARVQDTDRSPLDDVPGGQQDRRVEIALQRLARVHPAHRLIERHPPVHSDHVGSRLAHHSEQFTGVHAEVQPRDTGPGQRGTLSSLLKDGLKAVTIRVNDVGDVGGFVLPGDHVDVVLTRPGDRKVSVNDVVLQDVRVLGVDQLADNTTDKPAVVKAVTLEVDETGGQKLALASMVGTLSLLLRKAGETKADPTRQISPLDLVNRAGPHGTASYSTIVVTRVGKDSLSLDQYSVPVEHDRKNDENAPSSALSAQHMAHE